MKLSIRKDALEADPNILIPAWFDSDEQTFFRYLNQEDIANAEDLSKEYDEEYDNGYLAIRLYGLMVLFVYTIDIDFEVEANG